MKVLNQFLMLAVLIIGNTNHILFASASTGNMLESIDKLQTAFVKNQQVLQDVVGKEVVVVLGGTGVGKSSLIALMCGAPLKLYVD